MLQYILDCIENIESKSSLYWRRGKLSSTFWKEQYQFGQVIVSDLIESFVSCGSISPVGIIISKPEEIKVSGDKKWIVPGGLLVENSGLLEVTVRSPITTFLWS